jgi:hypothetical protein
MKRMTRMLFSMITLTTMLVPGLLAEVPHMINYQGRIIDASGIPVDGSYSITFKIYNDPTAGTILWSESHSAVAVTDGLFHVDLGSIVTLGSDVLSSQPRWLGLTLDGNPELSPRTQILAVAFAYRAEHADTANYAHTGSGGGWVDDGSTVRLSSSTDKVGIGTVDPQEKLDVNGDVRLGASSDIAFGDDNTRIYATGGDIVLTADDDVHLQPDDDIYVRKDGGSAWVHFDNSAERLGVGTTNPEYKLTVNGEVSIADGGVSKYHINYYQGGLNFAETGVQDRRIHINDGGNVGIGTANPGAKLGVNGDLKVTGAFKGDISSSSGTEGAPFPRPAYDSGWFAFYQGTDFDFTHNIGGDINNYFVDLQFKHNGYMGIHNRGIGVDITPWDYNGRGGHWYGLTPTMITVSPAPGSGLEFIDSARVRIWLIE